MVALCDDTGRNQPQPLNKSGRQPYKDVRECEQWIHSLNGSIKCDQILGKPSKSHIGQNQTNTTSGQLHYHTTSVDPQHCLNYSRLVLTDVYSGRFGRLEWWCLAF